MGLVWRKDDLLTLSEKQLSMANETCQQKIYAGMARIYATLIRKGEKTIEDVPERLRAAVEALLAEDAV